MKINNKLRQKFIKDFNLSINVVNEPYFSYLIKLFGYEEQYDLFVKTISRFDNYESFRSFIDEILGYKKDGMIVKYVKSLDSYNDFINMDMNKYKIDNAFYKNELHIKNLYTNDKTNRKFISIDLTTANFQSLKYVGILKEDKFEEFLSRFTNDEYFYKTKILRQIIFGKLCPKRQRTVIRYIMDIIFKQVKDICKNFDCEPIKYTEDEILIDVTKLNNTLLLEKLINYNIDFDIHVKTFYIRSIDTDHGSFYYKQYFDNSRKIKSCDKRFYTEVFKLIHNMPIDLEYDLYAEEKINKEIIRPFRYMGPIKLITN